jgi:ABC-type transport system involved in multi-copper enzyme maturation permease subunit
MINFYYIRRIAFYEARLLFRSWGFRIFSVLGLTILTILNIAIATPAFYSPYFLSSLSGSLPLNSLKLFNIFQGIIVALMATEFFKRDRKHDSIQVVLARSFSNMEYFLGKVLGILSVFFLLNIAILSITFVIHVFFSNTLFVWQPYILYMLLICLPTLIFMIGMSFLLSSLLQNQAVVFLFLLAYSFLALILLGTPIFGLLDSYAFYLPLMYSDFIGLGNIHSVLLIRMSYLFLGLSFIFVSPVLSKRLRQSKLSNIMTGSLSIVCLVLALMLGLSYTSGKYADRDYRHQLRASNQAVMDSPVLTVFDYSIQLEHQGKNISATTDMKMRNDSSTSLDSVWLTLNPGLKVQSVSWEGNPLNFQQDKHIIRITPHSSVKPGDSIDLSIAYSGKIDERYCFLDIDDNRFESRFRLWIYDIPKHYALVTSNYVFLTPESGWYPIAGLSTGKAFPAAAAPQYSTYTLSVLSSEGMTAISQGKPETKSLNGRIQHTFKPETKLPQISLTIGPYEHQEIQVDNVIYSLYFQPGHDYFTPYLNEIGDSIPDLIRALKDEYEVILDLDYPFKRLSLVEVPIHIYSYQRLWTVAFETVQPQLVFLPEMGTFCANADFQTQARNWEKWGKAKKGKGNVTLAQVQSYYFNNFIRTNLLNAGTEQMGYIKGEGMAVSFQAEIEPEFELFPNFVTYTTYFSSSQWPVLNYAFESYLRERYTSPQKKTQRRRSGLSSEEEINLDLKKQSLFEMMEDPTLDASIVQGALQAKGRMLLALLEAKSADSDFSYWLTDFLKQNRFRTVHQQDLNDFLSTYFDLNLAEIIDPWYSDSQIPGYILSDVESYTVIDREKTWTQVNFKVANPTHVDGVIRIDMRYRSMSKDKNVLGPGQSDYSKTLLMPAETTLDVGISVDQPPALMTIETYVSQNIPASINVPFPGRQPQRKGKPFDTEISKPFDSLDFVSSKEYIIDNQDEGFQILGTAKQGWLSRNMQKLFGTSDEESPYTGMNVYDPPAFWALSANQQFYGQIVRSAYLKKAGEGEDKVVWNVDLEEKGNYDIFFYNGIPLRTQKEMLMRAAAQNQAKLNATSISKGQRNRGPGKRFFLVSHQYGMEEVVIDLENAEQGWNLIGSYQLDAGPNKIEQTDKNETLYVMADAVKWVKR